jgi:predicted HAD superfamily Cof-like phosphohydrolase
MSTIREQVTEFHRAFHQPVLDWPQAPPDERVRLRLRLVLEEAFELLEACVATARLRSVGLLREKVFELIEDVEVKVGLVALADALADLDYVSEGTRLEFGIDGAPIAAEVHRSNMAKVWPDGTVQKNEGGKVLKPPDWTPPDIYNELLKQQCGQPVAQGAASSWSTVSKIDTKVTLDLTETSRFIHALDERVAALATRVDKVAVFDVYERQVSLELNRVSTELGKRLTALEERVAAPAVKPLDADKGTVYERHVSNTPVRALADEVLELNRVSIELAKRLSVLEERVDHHVVDVTVDNKVVTPATADEVQELWRAVSGLAERLGHAEGAIVGVTRGLLLR